jgi:SAM-dependent methyltransferase
VLMIGCGGGTLATLLIRAGIQVTVVDNNPTAFFIASQYFQMPAEVRTMVEDGAKYLASCHETFDAVILDAYDGSAIPQHLRSLDFLRLVRRRLDRSDGVFLANVYLHHDFDFTADRLVESALDLWPNAAVLDAVGYHRDRNSIVIAGAVDNLDAPELLVPPNAGHAEIENYLCSLQFRKGRLSGIWPANVRFRRLASYQTLHQDK